jgi:hypothetical protein
MKLLKLTIFLIFIGLPTIAQNTAKPWAYWWWPGSAVNESDLKISLQKYAEAGFGGLHIIPIYGVKGEEEKFIPFLSQRWLQIVEFTCQEAKKLNLGIDISLGTGWPYGGPAINEQFAAKAIKFIPNNQKIDLQIKNTGQKVKRAAPGGEGLVMDHFSLPASLHYFQQFEKAFKSNPLSVRAFYNDSYEVYGANWTPDFFAEFQKYRHYDLQNHLHALVVKDNYTLEEKRIWADYQETISDLLLYNFTRTYTAFAHSQGKINRNESHGSPANILDLYAASDLPESEFFGSKPYAIPGYRQDPDYEESRFGKPNIAVLKLASSPAHLFGKKLVSSETATWLGNHFKVSLAQVKPIIDESFMGGINHIFYHGVPYTPPAEPFPGWLFYASTNFNFNAHFWNELPLLNSYIENCQNILQNSQADHQVLLYFPIHEIWHQPKESLHLIDVHNIEKTGVFTPEYRKIIDDLTANGIAFDFISDRQILELQKGKEGFGIKNQVYKALLFPKMDYFPLATLQKIDSLKTQGLSIAFSEKLPQHAAGFQDWQKKQQKFDYIIGNFKENIHSNIINELKKTPIKIEKMASHGLSFIRKKNNENTLYFVANQTAEDYNEIIELATPASHLVIYDPLNNLKGQVKIENTGTSIRFHLHLPAGQSRFLLLNEQHPQAWKEPVFENTLPIEGQWQVNFTKGQPFLPQAHSLQNLSTWTQFPDTTAQYFNGEARYQIAFNLPKKATKKTAELHLGEVRESARVYINGKEIGTAWSLPFTLQIPPNTLKTKNTLEIYVRNSSINQVRYLDKQKVNWKKFYDINLVDINYKPFDASTWTPTPSGLIGPVILKY